MSRLATFVTVIFFLLLTPVIAEADGLHSVSSAVQFDVSYRCLARGAAEPPPNKAHLWIYPVDTNRSFTPGMRVFAGFPNDVDYEDLTVLINADVPTSLFQSWIFKNKSRIYGNRGEAAELSADPEDTRGLLKVHKITSISASWDRGFFNRTRYTCALHGSSTPDPEPPTPDPGPASPCTPTTDALQFDGGYRVRMCYTNADGSAQGQAQAGIWASGQSGLLWFFDRGNAEALVKVLDGCSHNGYRWVYVAPVTDLGFELRITAPDGRMWTHTNQAGTTAAARSDTNAFRCQ